MKILFIVPYPLQEAPSQRFRFEQYFKILEAKGFTYRVQSFLNSQNWQIFYRSGNSWQKLVAVLSGFARRVKLLFALKEYNFIFIHREVTPVGPPVFEWIITRVFKKKIIYDFDDAIWLTDKSNEYWIERITRWRSKVAINCSLSHKVSCGNDYLGDYAKRFNKQVVINPTTIDTDKLHTVDDQSYSKKKSNQSSLIIGWTGSHSTLKYLKMLEPVLQKIESKFENVEFWVIADRAPSLNIKRIIFKSWSLQTEIEDLKQIDIGIMPLPDDEWAKGKCGFKALQYMSLEIPTIASPVGVNSKIIDHGKNGFFASDPDQWMECLVKLILDKELRKDIGKKGRETVIANYSVISNSSNFLSLFE